MNFEEMRGVAGEDASDFGEPESAGKKGNRYRHRHHHHYIFLYQSARKMGKGRMMSLSFLLSIVHTPLW